MNADLHRRVKELFAELCELPDDQQAGRLKTLTESEPEVARELKSLLKFHTKRSMVVDTPTPKIRTRSTLSKTFRSRPSIWTRILGRTILFAVPLLLLGYLVSYWAHKRIVYLLRDSVGAQLEDLIDQRLQQFRQWENSEIITATSLTRDSQLVEMIKQLVRDADTKTGPSSDPSWNDLRSGKHSDPIQKRLNDLAGKTVKFAIWNRSLRTIADWSQQSAPHLVGAPVTPRGAAMLTEVIGDEAQLFLPGQSTTITEGFEPESAITNIFVLAPIRDESGTAIAVMMLRGFGLEDRYAALFERWTKNHVNETYLVTDRGAQLTTSRYGEIIDHLGLAETTIDHNATHFVRDPGVNLLADEVPEFNVMAWPLTFSARQVTSGNNGISIDGYRNYVGVDVVGAWRWLADHGIGMIVEEHASDAFAAANTTKEALVALASLFAIVLTGLGILSARGYALGIRDLSDVGPYKVQELLGEGGMGRVYLAEHALLCRQSAVKILNNDGIDLSVINRFEREVQLTSQLTHPNTIAIYDFGRNKDGNFYYAMEYINGAHLGQLVEYAGPIHPGRTIFILKQLCRALTEAHQAGVVHRDIKPQNIMVCNRGGEPDFVKLFDYGLVKAFAPGVASPTTSLTKIVVGTPRFMAPERLNSPWLADPRVDIYSVGAVAYYLLTGKLPPLFTLSGPVSHEQPGIETLDLPVGAIEFGDLLGMCLSPEPSNRPSSMQILLRDLDELAERFPWSREDSIVWWQNHEAKLLRLVKSKQRDLEPRKQSAERR